MPCTTCLCGLGHMLCRGRLCLGRTVTNTPGATMGLAVSGPLTCTTGPRHSEHCVGQCRFTVAFLSMLYSIATLEGRLVPITCWSRSSNILENGISGWWKNYVELKVLTSIGHGHGLKTCLLAVWWATWNARNETIFKGTSLNSFQII